MSESNFITCICQHCSGRIKFDANQLRENETRQIECPHCHLETILYVPPITSKTSPHSQKENILHDKTIFTNQPKSSKPELAFFEITRFLTLAGAFLVSFALVITGFLVIKTFLPEKPPSILLVSYDAVAPIIKTASQNQNLNTPSSSRMASKGTFPQPVVDFLVKHQDFSLKVWLDQLKLEHRKPFLDNLAKIIQTANSKQLTDEQFEKVVTDYGDFWISQNEKMPDPNAAIEKRLYRASCISIVFGLFISLTILCLILVLLAIERNTRLNVHK